jgi:adenosylhomocysteine/aminodeoxyfutalosine nucleosidase
MRIAILGAMEEEIEPLLSHFGEYETIEYAENKFYKANYKGLELVVAYSKIGKVFATMTTSILIEKFKCEKLLFSGVAGGINPELKIGDLIIGTGLCQHDLDITEFGHPHGYVPGGEVCTLADESLVAIAKDVAESKSIPVKTGIIATGDQFVACNDKKCFIQEKFEADALEMEGAAVAVTCKTLGVPFFVLRAISDTADMDAGFSFDEFLKSSAKNSADFIVSMLDVISEGK